MNKSVQEKNNRVTNNDSILRRDLFMQDYKRNLKYLKEVLDAINFVVESVEINQRDLYAPIVKFINHDKKTVNFNSLLNVMGLCNYRVTPKGKLKKLESIIRSNQNRQETRQTQYIRRMARVTPNDVKLLADLLKSKQQLIITYLKVLKELEI